MFERFAFKDLKTLNKLAFKLSRNGFRQIGFEIVAAIPEFLETLNHRLIVKSINPDGNMMLLDIISW
jgi:hypothetical protein